jgi:transcriptional regulator with XRE-family HTH domain
MSLDAKLIGARIRKLRLARGLSQRALGKALGAKFGHVGDWESGVHAPGLTNRSKLAEFFKVSIEFISCDGDQRSAVRDMALTLSKEALESGKATSADIRTVATLTASAASDAEKAVSAREEEFQNLMKGVHERLICKLRGLREKLEYE